MEPDISETQLAAWRNLITFHARTIERIDRALVEAGCVPLHWYDVLIELYEAPEKKLRMHELAAKVVLSRSGLTRLVDRLEEAELLRRQPDPRDRRGFYATLTVEGARALRKAWPIYAHEIGRNFASHLDEEKAQLLSATFAAMLRGINPDESSE